MKNFKQILVMFLGTFLFACEDEEVDPIITVTPVPILLSSACNSLLMMFFIWTNTVPRQ